jgi:hypothetical protein
VTQPIKFVLVNQIMSKIFLKFKTHRHYKNILRWSATIGNCLAVLTTAPTNSSIFLFFFTFLIFLSITIKAIELQNCLLFSCTTDNDCREGIKCYNSRCDGLNSTQLRCETNGTILPLNSALHRYYFPYPPGGGRNANQSLSDCTLIGANLLSVDSPEELEFIRGVLRSLNVQSGYSINRYVSSVRMHQMFSSSALMNFFI